eukprot:1686965-Rhodomonas_salina.2
MHQPCASEFPMRGSTRQLAHQINPSTNSSDTEYRYCQFVTLASSPMYPHSTRDGIPSTDRFPPPQDRNRMAKLRPVALDADKQ